MRNPRCGLSRRCRVSERESARAMLRRYALGGTVRGTRRDGSRRQPPARAPPGYSRGGRWRCLSGPFAHGPGNDGPDDGRGAIARRRLREGRRGPAVVHHAPPFVHLERARFACATRGPPSTERPCCRACGSGGAWHPPRALASQRPIAAMRSTSRSRLHAHVGGVRRCTPVAQPHRGEERHGEQGCSTETIRVLSSSPSMRRAPALPCRLAAFIRAANDPPLRSLRNCVIPSTWSSFRPERSP